MPQSGRVALSSYVNERLGFEIGSPGSGWTFDVPPDMGYVIVRLHRALSPDDPVYQIDAVLAPTPNLGSLRYVRSTTVPTVTNKQGVHFVMACGGAVPTCRFRFNSTRAIVVLHVAIHPKHASYGDRPSLALSRLAQQRLATVLNLVRLNP